MTPEEFEEFTQRVDKMKDILSWVKTSQLGTFLGNDHGGLGCMDCPLHRYNPKWANLPEYRSMCNSDYHSKSDSCTKRYENVFNIWAKYALEEALDDI